MWRQIVRPHDLHRLRRRREIRENLCAGADFYGPTAEAYSFAIFLFQIKSLGPEAVYAGPVQSRSCQRPSSSMPRQPPETHP
ncbi:hypothetical protein EVAR_84836_1 [Eumeta japonica]|uniref:Uncharacterized protein n=1 Tax=Eumeta variegata TaxID=151549 RepID=A0A4C1U9M7_EUMVA|nr:hypothetical protein EVAR_84836_1 [Eumeta japonica]